MKENSRGIHENNRMGGERSHYLFSSVAQRLELSEINWRSLAMMPLVTLPVCIFNASPVLTICDLASMILPETTVRIRFSEALRLSLISVLSCRRAP